MRLLCYLTAIAFGPQEMRWKINICSFWITIISYILHSAYHLIHPIIFNNSEYIIAMEHKCQWIDDMADDGAEDDEDDDEDERIRRYEMGRRW